MSLMENAEYSSRRLEGAGCADPEAGKISFQRLGDGAAFPPALCDWASCTQGQYHLDLFHPLLSQCLAGASLLVSFDWEGTIPIPFRMPPEVSGLRWSLWREGWEREEPFDRVFLEGDRIRLERSAPFPDGEAPGDCVLRMRLEEPHSPFSGLLRGIRLAVCRTPLAPEQVVREEEPLDPENFDLFTPESREGDCCYLACGALSLPGAEVSLQFELSFREYRFPLEETESREGSRWSFWKPKKARAKEWREYRADQAVFEYYNGERWTELPESAAWRERFCRETEQEKPRKLLTFQRPDDIGLCEIAGRSAYWIRIRLVSFQMDGYRPCSAVLPVLSHFRTGGEAAFVPERLDAWDGLEQRVLFQTGDSMLPPVPERLFTRMEEPRPCQYFLFSPGEGNFLSLFWDLPQARPPLWMEWQYSRADGSFSYLDVVDGTDGLSHSGRMQFRLPEDSGPCSRLGREGTWIRAVFSSKDTGTVPVRGIYGNCYPAYAEAFQPLAQGTAAVPPEAYPQCGCETAVLAMDGIPFGPVGGMEAAASLGGDFLSRMGRIATEDDLSKELCSHFPLTEGIAFQRNAWGLEADLFFLDQERAGFYFQMLEGRILETLSSKLPAGVGLRLRLGEKKGASVPKPLSFSESSSREKHTLEEIPLSAGAETAALAIRQMAEEAWRGLEEDASSGSWMDLLGISLPSLRCALGTYFPPAGGEETPLLPESSFQAEGRTFELLSASPASSDGNHGGLPCAQIETLFKTGFLSPEPGQTEFPLPHALALEGFLSLFALQDPEDPRRRWKKVESFQIQKKKGAVPILQWMESEAPPAGRHTLMIVFRRYPEETFWEITGEAAQELPLPWDNMIPGTLSLLLKEPSGLWREWPVWKRPVPQGTPGCGLLENPGEAPCRFALDLGNGRNYELPPVHSQLYPASLMLSDGIWTGPEEPQTIQKEGRTVPGARLLLQSPGRNAVSQEEREERTRLLLNRPLRAVTLEDYRQMASGFFQDEGISGKVQLEAVSASPGRLHFRIKGTGRDGLEISAEEKERFLRRLETMCPAGVELRVE